MHKFKNILFIIFYLFCSTGSICSQNSDQTIRGVVVDRNSKYPLPGVNIILLDNIYMGTISNTDGEFNLEKVPIGRHTVQFSFIGYKPIVFPSVLVGSGKEVVLNVEMEETAIGLDEVVVRVETEKDKTLNKMSIISARTFTVEETES